MNALNNKSQTDPGQGFWSVGALPVNDNDAAAFIRAGTYVGDKVAAHL
jgi:hypothetical protein